MVAITIADVYPLGKVSFGELSGRFGLRQGDGIRVRSKADVPALKKWYILQPILVLQSIRFSSSFVMNIFFGNGYKARALLAHHGQPQ